MITEPDLLRQHAHVLFDLDSTGRLVAVNEPEADAPPRLFLARGRSTHELWLRQDVSVATADDSRSIAARIPAWDGSPGSAAELERLGAALGRDDPIGTVFHGPAYRFGERVEVAADADVAVIDDDSAHLLEAHFPYTRSILERRQPVVGAILDGRVVAACWSSRVRPTACEAGVATEGPYRGRGLAPLVVSRWRHEVERDGRVPLYSTEWDNLASQAVAGKLRLIPYADTYSLT